MGRVTQHSSSVNEIKTNQIMQCGHSFRVLYVSVPTYNDLGYCYCYLAYISSMLSVMDDDRLVYLPW